jgi:polyphosphate glucokinase
VTKKKNYDEYIGEAALKDKGEEEWNKRMERVLEIIKTVFNYDTLYISGGNAELINFKLEDNIHIKTNKDGFLGAVNLWKYQMEIK